MRYPSLDQVDAEMIPEKEESESSNNNENESQDDQDGELQANALKEPETLYSSEEEKEQLIQNEEKNEPLKDEKPANREASLVKKEESIWEEKQAADETRIIIPEVAKTEETTSASSRESSSSILQAPVTRFCFCFSGRDSQDDYELGLLKLGSCCGDCLDRCLFWISYLYIICLIIFILFRFKLDEMQS